MASDKAYHDAVVQVIQSQTDPVKRKVLKAAYFATLYGGPSKPIQAELNKLADKLADKL